MATHRAYTTAAAFRRALEERLKNRSQAEQIDINRLRRQVSFDRLLARLFRDDTAPWALKGGYALELRFKSARSTIDIDLTVQRVVEAIEGGDAVRAIREMLQNAADVSLNDWFEYTIGPPVMDLTAAPYGGARYSVETRMDGRIFARFHLDAGVGDVVIQPLETVECYDWLGFAGIAKPRVRMISREQQFAEKIHAYTLPRSSANSRVKDLVDLALLIGENQLDRRKTFDALRLTFERRNTHALPTTLKAPPENWQTPFEALAEECGLQTNIAGVFDSVRKFAENVLAGGMEQ
ncbi:MAG: nucleotidyl transferase AbiEii/AbiGii toxin family protein [Candidatus Korobacteraceae bacterium]